MPIYEYECRDCGMVSEYLIITREQALVDPGCRWCSGPTEMRYSLYCPRAFEPFTTNNILPDGKPVTVRGPGQLAQLENEHHVKMIDVDAPPPQTRFHKPDLAGKPPDWYKGGD